MWNKKNKQFGGIFVNKRGLVEGEWVWGKIWGGKWKVWSGVVFWRRFFELKKKGANLACATSMAWILFIHASVLYIITHGNMLSLVKNTSPISLTSNFNTLNPHNNISPMHILIFFVYFSLILFIYFCLNLIINSPTLLHGSDAPRTSAPLLKLLALRIY